MARQAILTLMAILITLTPMSVTADAGQCDLNVTLAFLDNNIQPGETVLFQSTGGLPDENVFLFLWTPFFMRIVKGQYDGNGTWTAQGTYPGGVAGQLSFVAITVDADGDICISNVAAVNFFP